MHCSRSAMATPQAPARFRWVVSLLVGVAFVGTPAVRGTEPAAEVTAEAASKRSEQIRRFFHDLADSRPSVREAARAWLLAMERTDLPALRDVVKSARFMQHSQVAALRSIVAHVYLAGDPYTPETTHRGFLGVMFGSEFEVVEPEAGGV